MSAQQLFLWFMSDINALTGGWKESLIVFSVMSFVLAADMVIG